MFYLKYTLSFLLLSVASASYLPMAQAQTDDALGVSIVGTPDSSFNNLAEQNLVSARQQIRISNLFAPYINSAGDEVTPSTANTRVLLALDLNFRASANTPLATHNTFFMRLRDGDDSNNAADTRRSNQPLHGQLDDVFVLLGGNHTGPIPNFTSGQCAGEDIADVYNPIRVGSSADRTQDGGASFTLDIFAEDASSNPDFHGIHFVAQRVLAVCSNHELFDATASNVALRGHVCQGTSFRSTFRTGARPLRFETCVLANSPEIGVVETARPDIVLSFVNTGMPETASVADILADPSATIHDFGNNLVFNNPEPDAPRPAINRAAIATNQMTLIARLSDNIVNNSGSAIVLNHLSDQLDQFASQFTFVPSPDFMATDGIPHGANGVVIGTILPLEDELMEGTIDYPLLVAGATDYIVATRESAIRAAIHTRLPMVDNPLTGVPEQQAADHIFRLALDLSGTPAQTQVQNQILPTIRVIDADDYFHYLVEGPQAALVSNAVRNTITEANTPPVVNLNIGLGGAQIAWGGNNPTSILSDASTRNTSAQVLSSTEFDMAEFLDPATPTFTASSLFVNALSTAELEGDFQDVRLEIPSEAVNIMLEGDANVAAYRSAQPWWRLRFVTDFIGDKHLEIALAMREINPPNFAAPRALRRLGSVTHLRYEVVGNLGASIGGTPDSSFNNLAEQNLVSARQQIRISKLFVPYINSAGDEVTPSTTDTRVLLALDWNSIPSGIRHLAAHNTFFMRLRDGDDSNNAADTRSSNGPLVGANDDVFVLLGGDHTGPIPNFTSGQCAGADIADVFNPIRVGSSADRTQDGGASFTLDIFVEDAFSNPDFHGVHSVDYRAFALCSTHELFDASASNVALTGHACQGESFTGTFGTGATPLNLETCILASSPEIGVVETARPDIVLSFVNTGMPETASVADILADPSATIHDFGNNLVFNTLEPDAARPAINRAAIATNQMTLIARLSDDIVNNSGSAIELNRLSDQLDQLPSQFTFVPSPDFMATGGIPHNANGVVIGTILPLEDELMEGTIDYPLLVAGATDYIVATRESAIRAAIHTRLPMVDNPLTGVPEQQAADHIFRLALDLSGTPAQTQVQNQILPTLRVIDADDYFHYLVEGVAELVSNAARRTFAEANTDVFAFIRVGLGGTQIAWGGNNPTTVFTDAITQSATIQTLTDEQFDRAAFLDPVAPTFTDRSTFANADSTVELEGEFQDVMLEYRGTIVNIVSNISPFIPGTTDDLWRLHTVPDFFAEGDEYLEIAFAFREASPANPAMPRMLRRLGPATHLRYEIIDAAMGDTELVMEARATAVAARRADYQLPIISEYLASDVVSASNNTAHDTVSVLTLPGVPQPPGGIVAQIDVYGHLGSRDGDLVLAGRAPVADAEIPESNLGYDANVAGTPVRRFYVQVGTTGSPIPTCVAGSEISADQVIAQPHLTGAHDRFELPISLGARRPDNAHPSTRYGGTRVLRLHASILCSDDPNYITGAPASHQWQDPDVLNTTNTDTRGIPVLLRDRADEFTLSYFAAATNSLPQASFTPSTQLGLHEADVVRPLPNTFAQLHIHAALTPTSAEFGQAPIVPISELGASIPISDFQAISTGICDGSEDCIPMPDTDTTDYYLGSIRAGIDANNTWESNSQLQLIGANTAHESAGTDFASAWLSPNPAIVADPLTDPDVMTARNALLVPSMPSALFNNRVFNAPALIISSIAPQSIMLQDAQSFISISATTPTAPGFTIIEGRQGDEDRGVEFQIHLGGMPTQPVEAITGLPDELDIQLGFVFRLDNASGGDNTRPFILVSETIPMGGVSVNRPEFRIDARSDARTISDRELGATPLGFNLGDTNTTSTLTLSGNFAHYYEARLALKTLNDPALTTEQRQRVLLRIFVDDDAGDARPRFGTVQAHLVEPPSEGSDYYIYPEDDPIAPSAVNFMLDPSSDTPIISCAMLQDVFNSRVNDFTQPYPRDCLSAQSTSAYAFSVETGGLDFVYAEEDMANSLVSRSSMWRGRLIRVHYYSPDDGIACASPPISGPLGADSPYVSGRYAGHNIFLSSNDLAGTREGNIVYVEAESLGDLTLEVDTRATGAAGATYCAVLEVNLGGANAYTEPERVNLPSYSMDDDNNNGLPDDLEIAGGAAGTSQALLYGRDYCRRTGSSYNSELGALNDCDNDGVPDLAELQYGPPEDNSDYTLMRAMCIAQGYYTRFPRANLGNLLCTNSVGDQLAASQTIAAIEGDWLLAIRGKDYAGVALEVDSAGPPTTFRADNGLLPSNSYWFANPDQRHVVEVYLAPTMRFRAPTSVLSVLTGHTFTVIEGNFVFPSASLYPMTAQLLGTVPESVGADIALELQTYESDGAPLDPPLNTQIRFEPHSNFTRALGTYRDHTVGYSNDTDAVIVGLLRHDVGDTQSSATATIDSYAVYFDRPNHPLHGATLRDQRRAGEYYEIDLTEIDGITSTNLINPQPETLQLLNAPTTASITTALGANPTASTLDFVLREHQILTQNAGVLYLGPHPAISTPTGLVDPQMEASRLQFALRARVDLSANYILGRDGTASFPFTNTSETWSLLPLGDESAEEIVLHTDIRTTGANPYTLPDVATLCNLLPTCQSETGGVDYARLLYRQRDLDTTGSVRIVYIAQLWLQLGGDPAQLFDDTDEDGVPEMDGDIEGALSLPFSASGRHGHIVVEQQQVALQLGYRARTQYQTDLSFARGANIGSGNTLDLDFHLSCVDHAGQPGDLLYEFDANAPATSYDLLRDISGGLIDTIPTPSISRDDLYYAGCLGYEVPVLIQMPESMAIATNINIPNTVAGFGVKSYSFSGGLPDGSCPPANAQSIWWQPDGMAPRFETERCIRLVLEGEPAMAGLPLMSGDSEPLRVRLVDLGDTGGGGGPRPGGSRLGGPGGDVALSNVGKTGGSGGGAFGIMQLLLLGLLAFNALRARRRYSLHHASRASA